MSRAAVFLDRDGVLVAAGDQGTDPPHDLQGLRILDGVAGAVQRLRSAGFELIVVTNQPDIARRRIDRRAVDAVHDYLGRELGLQQFEVCPHDNGEGCRCRKPQPGLLLSAARALSLDLGRSWMVGDRWVDIAAGSAASVQTVLIDRPYSWASTSSGLPPAWLRPDHRADDLASACDLILLH